MCILSLYKETLSRKNEIHSFDYRIHLKFLSAKSVNALSTPCIAMIHELYSHSNFSRLLYRCRHLSPLPYAFTQDMQNFAADLMFPQKIYGDLWTTLIFNQIRVCETRKRTNPSIQLTEYLTDE